MDTAIGLYPVLAEGAARGALLVAAAGVLALLLRRASAAARHMVWASALAGVLALPLIQLWAPRLEVPIPELLGGVWDSAVPGPGDESNVRVLSAATVAADARSGYASTSASAAPSDPVAGATSVLSGPSTLASLSGESVNANAASPPSVDRLRMSSSGALVALWLAGSLVLIVPMLAGRLGVRRLERHSRRCMDERIGAMSARLSERAGLRREPRLRIGPERTMPMTWGIVRPVVVLPEEALCWPAARLEAVLLHEYAHVARRDCLTQMMAELARVIHWFNPLVWLAARRLRIERELACDDAALRNGARASEYARELLALARACASPAASHAAVAMAKPNQLRHRLAAVLDERRPRARSGSRTAARTVVAGFVVAVPLAAVVPAQKPAPVQARPPVAPAPRTPPGAARMPAAPVASVPPAAPGALPAMGAQLFLPPPAAEAPLAHAVPMGPRPPIVWENAVPPSTAPQGLPPQQGLTCAEARSGWRSVNHNTNDDVSTIRMSRTGCNLEVRLEGDIEFDGEAIGIARMGRGARLRIEEDDGRRDRRLDIVPGAGGAPSFEYLENGREAEFDTAARDWYRAVLLQLFRRVGFAASERVAALLRRGSVPAVLEEVELLESDYVRSRYITELLGQAELNEAQYRTVVSTAARRVESDHYLAEILKAVAAEQPLTARLLDDYVAASRQLESDHYRTEVLRGVIGSGRLNAQQTAAVIESAGEMESDHYRAELLKDVAHRYALEPAFRAPYLRATESMESDHYRVEALKPLLLRSDLSAAEMGEVLRAARMVESDHYLTELLKSAASRALAEPALQRAFLDAVTSLESDHYFVEAIGALIDHSQLQPQPLASLLEFSARELESDHYLSEMLIRVLDRHTITAEVRPAFMTALDSIESEHYRGRVANRLLRAERR